MRHIVKIANLLGFGLVIWMMIIIAPKIEQLLIPDAWIHTVEKSNVDVGALFYTEEPNAEKAEQIINAQLQSN